MIKLAIKHSIYPGGGAERVTEHLSRYLGSRGYHIFIIVEHLNRDILSDFDRQNVTFVHQPMESQNNDGLVNFLIETVNELGIDILLCPDSSAHHIELLRQQTNCKLVFSLHSVPGWWQIAYYAKKRHEARRSVFKFLFWYLLKGPFERARGRVGRKIRKTCRIDYTCSDLFTVLVPEYKARLEKMLRLPAGENHIAVMPNYIEPRDYGTPAKKKQVLFVGRLNHYDKRVDRLIAVWGMIWRKHPDWELIIVGSGAEQERLERLAGGMERVRFCGWMEPWPFYRDAAISCLTSTFEGWPMVIAEAQQAGCVPVAFDASAGIRDQIAEGCGFLVPPFDLKAYAARLSQLMEDDELRARMSAASTARARSYSSEERLSAWDEQLRKLGVRS